jgi:hypothetical protein
MKKSAIAAAVSPGFVRQRQAEATARQRSDRLTSGDPILKLYIYYQIVFTVEI